MNFIVTSPIPSNLRNTVCLIPDTWDDFHFKTGFDVIYFDKNNTEYKIGYTKIGYLFQEHGYTKDKLPKQFTELSDDFFSVGQDVDFYRNINELPTDTAEKFLTKIQDLAFSPNRIDKIRDETVFRSSLLRNLSINNIKNQFNRVINGGAPLSEYYFQFKLNKTIKHNSFTLNFSVTPNSFPPTNIHGLIGRNGVGKTTLLNTMVNSLLKNKESLEGNFKVNLRDLPFQFEEIDLPTEYFSSVVSVAFSAFDNFTPPNEELKHNIKYHYIGLKTINNEVVEFKNLDKLREEMNDSVKVCLSTQSMKNRWIKAIKTLESDDNFYEMNLTELSQAEIHEKIKMMSSGHAIVFLTISKLVECIEEKTLVLIDEPESHLHPPLLSAFIRALSDLLINRNGVALIATHSPVVLQEIPKTCVSIMNRLDDKTTITEPDCETFAENVGTLTKEVFGLEVTKSGFHKMLTDIVNSKKTENQILMKYLDKLGLEGRLILKSLLRNKTNNENEE